MQIKRVAVIGGGTMGNGIVLVFALNEIPVHLVEVSRELADKAVRTIEENLERMVRKDNIDHVQKIEALDNIKTFTNLIEGVSKVDMVIEAVPEEFALKKKVLKEADRAAPKEAILASNTSSLSITKLASQTERPDRFIGMHFFNPVPIMTLVELVKGFHTSETTYSDVEKVARLIDKTPVEAEDSPGFISNRILMPMINEAIFCVYEGIATPGDVDAVMKLGMNHPMGPLRLADFIGLDVCLDILEVLHDGFKDPKYRPCPLLVKMVDAGRLGDKTGEGFYKHD